MTDIDGIDCSQDMKEGIKFALQGIIAEVDYDIHKMLECDESDGSDHYDELVDRFLFLENEWHRK